jgi:polar amino acid transport system permease protein
VSYAGGGAHGLSDALLQPDVVIARLRGAKMASRRRFRLVFSAVWIVLIVAIGGGMLLAANADWDFVLTSGRLIVVEGAPITILVAVLSIFFATILAVMGALARLSTNPIFNAIGSFYVSLFRGTPLLLQIFFMYFALPQLGPAFVLPAIAAGVTALSLNYGAYMTEIFRAGIQAVPRGQREAAEAIGMPENLVMRRIVLPQAVRIVIPAIGNEFIAMIKDSALVSIITVHETLFLAQRLGRSAFQPLTALLIAGAVYWTLTIIFSFFQERLERRLARSDR